ncbi:MAG: sugar phosphate isomerase/epimerase [Acidobacteriota bacterium]|nr:sugar phosphate isomerase/epimerase [Acidobacteriota bacterium]
MTRRTLLASAASSLAFSQSSPGVRLGIDLFSIRSQGWTPFEYLDYAARQGAKVVHFSEIRFIGSLDPANLKQVRAHAAQLGIQIEIGMRSICPSSKMFDPKQGSAEEQLTRMITAAQIVGSPIVRAVLGSMEDRKPPGIEARIADTVKVLRAVRSRVLDAGIKIAIENHAGDMQARELKSLIEAAGKDFVGVCLDSGNPLWTIEDPHLTLETLYPYVLTSHVRDTAVWPAPDGGAAVQWVRMGDGNIGIDEYVRRYAELCPGRALSLEIIVTQPRIFAYNDPKFWDSYRQTPAWEFARFAQLVQNGKPRPKQPPVPKELAAERERQDLEASLEYTKKLIKI